MTTLEVGFAVLSATLLLALIVMALFFKTTLEAYETMRRSSQHWEDQFNAMSEIVQHYERKNRERRDKQ